jgi:hypothetical protein
MQPIAFFKRFSFHFLLLILFFLLHGYSEYIGLIPFTDLLIFFLIAAASGGIFFFIFKKITGTSRKAGVLTTLILLFYLFYGSIKDGLKDGWLHSLSRYSILVPTMLVLLVILAYYFRKTKKDLPKLTLFINCLLLIYLLVDITSIIIRRKQSADLTTSSMALTVCDTCAKPDIYFILLDEYTGTETLQSYFHYDNRHFEEALRQKGFFVANDPSGNYSVTPVAVASLFTMDYLPEFHRQLEAEDYTRSEYIVDRSIAMQLLKANGYKFINHSIFNLDKQPGQFTASILPTRLKLITSKTLWNSIVHDLGWQVDKKMAPRFNWLAKMIQDDYQSGNQRLLDLTREAASVKADQPRFIYTHLLMPHWPYMLDSTGKSTGINFFSDDLPRERKEAAYVQYLAYTNKVMLELVELIKSKSSGNAVIVLLSDHGYRARPGKTICREVNDNFMSVYLPGKNYRLFYDSISNVNVFRALFNTVLKQEFRMLPDNCIY